jgi:phage/plasmid-like protein (TIGR03299 family)
MSKETMEWLNANTRIGFTDKRGHAWHYREGATNHYPGAVPLADAKDLLGSFEPVAVDRECECRCGEVSREIVRSDTRHRMGVFKAGYVAHGYSEWLLDNVASILDDSLSIGSCGLLRNGAQAWVSVEVPDNIITPEGVEFRPNLLACTSFDGSLATTYKRVVTNVVCDNTMAIGLSEDGQVFKAKHTRNSGFKIAAARDALALVHAIEDEFMAEVKRLCEIEVSERQWQLFVEKHVPDTDDKGKPKTGCGLTKCENERDQLTMMWKTDQRVSPWRGTAWGVVQAVNTYAHHAAVIKGGNRAATNMANMVSGKTRKMDAQTVETLALVLA